MNIMCKKYLIRPSLKNNNPKDAKHGDGQYFSDIKPGTLRDGQLAYTFKNIPNQHIYSYYISIDVQGLGIEEGRSNVFVHKTRENLDISKRIVGWGKN